MSTVIDNNNQAYGLSQALLNIFPQPIVAKKNPTVKDKAQFGTTWVNTATNDVFILTSIVNNSANWEHLNGGTNDFANLTVTPGPISLTGTTTINTTGAADTTIGTGGTGAVFIGNVTGNTGITGTLTTTDSLFVAAGGMTVVGDTEINTVGAGDTSIGVGGTGNVNIGNVTGSVSILSTLSVLDGITATTGDITCSTGDIVATIGDVVAASGNLAAVQCILAGPIKIFTGAGVPANGLADAAGDFYINTTPTGATDRLFVATAASSWTNVVCAA